MEYMDEGSAGVAKDALHNFKLDGENKIKVRTCVCAFLLAVRSDQRPSNHQITFARK